MKQFLLTLAMAVTLQCGYTEDGRALCDLTPFSWCETSQNELICGMQPQGDAYNIKTEVQCQRDKYGKERCLDPRFNVWRVTEN